MKVKESEKVGLKLNIQKTNIMTSGPINSWQTEKQWKQWQALFFWAPESLQMVTAIADDYGGRGTRDQIANIRWIIEKAREFQKNIYFCFIDYAKAFDCVDHNKLWKIL